MKIQSTDNISFTSLNNPVKKFNIFTPKGKLHVQEVRLKEKSVDFSFNISKFINENFIDGASDPLWKEFLKPEKEILLSGKNERYAKYLRDVFKNDDGNTTLLLARDGQNWIKGAILSLTYNDPASLYDPKLCNIEAVCVDKDYRGFGVGKKLMEKTMQSAKNAFTDAVLTGYNKAVPFYKKLGFQILTQDSRKNMYFYKELQKEREDIPRYTQLMFKPLQPKNQRFYERIKPENPVIAFFKNLKKQITG